MTLPERSCQTSKSQQQTKALEYKPQLPRIAPVFTACRSFRSGSTRSLRKAAGFKKSVLGPFPVEVNQVVRMDVSLEVGAVAETVEVTAVAPPLQTETTQTGQTLGTKRLTDLPLNGRNIVSAMLLIPGAVQTNPSSVNTASRFSGRAFVNGNREQTNNFLLDGVDVNDSMDNRIGYTPSVDALQEVQVMTGNGSSEFGNSAGAVVNMTLKSGSNDFHGSLFDFFRNDNLDANSFFANQNTALAEGQAAPHVPTESCTAERSAAALFGTSCSSSETTKARSGAKAVRLSPVSLRPIGAEAI